MRMVPPVRRPVARAAELLDGESVDRLQRERLLVWPQLWRGDVRIDMFAVLVAAGSERVGVWEWGLGWEAVPDRKSVV